MGPHGTFRIRKTAAALMLAALGPAPGVVLAAAPDVVLAAANAAVSAPATERSWFSVQLRKFRNYPHLDRGYRLLKAQRLAEARREFEDAVRIDPDDVGARTSYALVLYKLQAYPECAAQFDQLLQQQPDNLSARLYRAMARSALGRLDEALSDFQRVAASPGIDRQDWLLAQNMIVELATRRQLPAVALTALNDLVASAPDADLLYRRGIANETSMRLVPAGEDFRRSLALASKPQQRRRALEAIARNAQARGDRAGERAALETALEDDPDDLSLLRALMQASSAQGLDAEAIEWARLALQRRPDPQDRRMLAELLMRTGNYPDAAQEYIRLAAAPGDKTQSFHVQMSLGYAYSNLKRWPEAAEAFGRAADIQLDATALRAQALALESAGRPTKAIAALQRLRALQPAEADLDLKLGTLYEQVGDAAAALRHLDQAARAGAPAATRAAAYRRRGLLLYAQGSYAAARQAQESAIALLPNDAALHAALAETCIKLGAYQDAVGYLQRGPGARKAGTTMRALVRAYQDAQNWDAAIEAGRVLVGMPGLTPAQRAEAQEALGIAYYQSGQREPAADMLQRAFDNGRNGWQARQILGLALFDLKRFDQALPHFQASVERHRTAQGLAYVARAYHAVHKPGLSAHYLQMALAEGGSLDPAFRTKLYDELGYLLSDAADYARAADAFSGSLRLDPRAETALRLARMQRLSGQLEQAESTLRTIAPNALEPSAQLPVYDELAQVHAARRQHVQAIDALSQANALQPSAERLYQIGLHQLELKQPQAATPALEAAVAQEPAQARYVQTLSYAYNLDGRPEQAEAALRAIALDRLDAPTQALVHDQLARSHAAQRRYVEAIDALSQANALQPSAERRYQIGLYQLELKQPQAAIPSLEEAASGQPDQDQYAETLGYAYNQAGRYADAARVLEGVIARNPDREVLYREIGYIHMHNLDNEAAVRWFKRGIDYRASRLAANRQRTRVPPRATAAVDHTERAAGAQPPKPARQSEQAEPARQTGPAEPVAPMQQDGAPEQASPIERAEQAQQAEPSGPVEQEWQTESAEPTRQAQRADPPEQAEQVQRAQPPDQDAFSGPGQPRSGTLPEAAVALRSEWPDAQSESPDDAGIRDAADAPRPMQASLSTASSLPGESSQGAMARSFESPTRQGSTPPYGRKYSQHYRGGARMQPAVWTTARDGAELRQGLRRVRMRRLDDADQVAARQAERAVDPEPSRLAADAAPPASTPEPDQAAAAENDAVIRQMRQEVAKLSNRFDATLYQSYRAHSSRQSAVASPTTGGVIPSQGGVELAYQPPVIGFRDERTLQLFVRTLWSNRPSSLAIERDSLQGGLGVRYKPLKTQQLYLSAERLVKIGDQSENNWLLRASYGWQNGIEISPDRDSWNYTTLYADVGYFAATPRRRALYVEARQGRSFKAGNAWSVTPHLVLSGRSEHPAPSQASYLEGGIGVSFRYQFNESRYETYRSSIELLLQYKRGIVHSGSGWVMTAIARF